MHFFVQYPLELSLLETKYNHNVYMQPTTVHPLPFIWPHRTRLWWEHSKRSKKNSLQIVIIYIGTKNTLQNTTFCIASIFITKCMLLWSQRTYKKREVLESYKCWVVSIENKHQAALDSTHTGGGHCCTSHPSLPLSFSTLYCLQSLSLKFTLILSLSRSLYTFLSLAISSCY